jgi:ATP-dependent helicase HrpB
VTSAPPTSTDLPVEAVAGSVVEALRSPGAAVLVAPPGAGKTTVVPLWIAADPVLGAGRVVVLEPRRLAARAAARRLADLLGEPLGQRVGYRTRDERVGGRDVRVEVITEGILVRRLQADPTLAGTTTVVLDEVHERNLVTDLSLALLVDVRASLRPDLAVLAMSATIDAERLASVLSTDGSAAPVVRSVGREHPVERRWWPPGPRDRPLDHVARSVQRVLAEPVDGDVLVFLPGAGEIARVERMVRDVVPPTVDVHPLHGSLPSAEQDRALAPAPAGRRRVVLATDIAESSLTVDGVRIVVDAGEARRPRYDPATGRTRLVTRPAPQASADQRAGRAGRLGPSLAVRLWAEAEHRHRPRFGAPEIAEVDLAGLALELSVWGSDPRDLALPDQPPPGAWAEAQAVLRELGALTDAGRPTPAGRRMADLPLHPRLARLVLAAHEQGLGWTGAVLAAVLDERDVIGGHRDERSADLAERVALVSGDARPATGSVALVRRRAREIARRVGAPPTSIDPAGVAPVVALAYPDRIAQARGGGRFRLRDGGGGWLPETDPLAAAAFLAVADLAVADRLDPRRGADGRIRLAAALDHADVERLLADRIEVVDETAWAPDRGDLRRRREVRAGAIVLRTEDGPAEPGEVTTAALLAHVEATGGTTLPWSDAARSLQARVALLGAQEPGWPDLADEALFAPGAVAGWLGPFLHGATSVRDLAALDLHAVLVARLDHRQQRALDRQLPRAIVVASGREVAVDYGSGTPMIRARAQDLYGTGEHPTVADGRLPVVVEVLSPADRPIQVTADLPGFWAGSWQEVRKEMAGRYPKHLWPVDPSAPSARAERRR